VAALAGAFLALSPVFDGYYDLTAWGAIGVVALVALVALVIASPHPLPRGAGWAAGALLVLAAVEFLSSRWAESVDRSLVDAHRTLLLATVFVLLCVIAQRRESRFALIGAIAVVTTVLNLVVAAVLLQPELPDGWFVTGRLYGPLGYTNGQGAAMLLGFWPLLVAAERVRSRALAGVALGAAAVSVNLFLLTQSRGGIAALALSALAMLAFVPGRLRRLVMLLPVAVGVAVVLPSMSDAYESSAPGTGVPDAGAVHDAVTLALLAALVVGVVGALLRAALPFERLEGRRVERALGIAVVVLVVGAGIGALASGAVERGWNNFKSLEPPSVESRLVSGGGNRYDYWRVAVDEWTERPLAGVGAGNYYRDYFRERRTLEDVRQPHSLPLQVLAETGLLGGLALLAFVLAVLAACVRAQRRSDLPVAERALAAAATGAFLVWLFHTSVDWIHLLPGVTGAALASAAVVVPLAARPRTTPARLRSPVRPLLFAGAVIAVASLGVLFLSERYRLDARDQVRSDPAGALARARDAFELNNQSVPTLYTVASAQARLNRYPDARSTLERAEELEPSNWVTPALLGDLAMRVRDFDLAAVSYGRAAELNPRNAELKKLETRAIDAGRVATPP
jgi:O-antigen ligase